MYLADGAVIISARNACMGSAKPTTQSISDFGGNFDQVYCVLNNWHRPGHPHVSGEEEGSQ